MVRRQGFTLVELLVVIAIIAVLIALLLPSLKKAKDTAIRVECLASLKGCGLAMEMYQEDNTGFIPVQSVNGGADGCWGNFLIEGKDGLGDTGHPIYLPAKAAICPAIPLRDSLLKNVDPNLTYGLYEYPKQNAFMQIYGYPVGNPPVQNIFNYAIYTERPSELETLGMNPGRSMMLCDTVEGQSGYGYLNWPFGVWSPSGPAAYSAGIQLLHGNMANVLFFDDHGESMTDHDMRYNTDTKAKYFYTGDIPALGYTLP